jgi:hypothetical protein
MTSRDTFGPEHAFTIVMDPPRQQSIESYGMGQSGYTAGRLENDPSLMFQARNLGYPWGTDEDHVREEGEDERFAGAGGEPWAPENDQYLPPKVIKAANH